MTHARAKGQGQRSFASKDRVEANRWMNGGDCITSCATHTHAHTQSSYTQQFYGSLDFVRDNPGELVPEETFIYAHLSSGFRKTRVFLKKPNPVGFFGFYWVFLDKQEKISKIRAGND